jgi:DNA-binding NtrC family response regulator
VPPALIADRFVRDRGGWLDLVTGAVVARPVVEDGRAGGSSLRDSGAERLDALAQRPEDAGFRVARLRGDGRDVRDTLEDVARRLHALGFVVLDGRLILQGHVGRELLHRHVALIARAGDADAGVVSWVRRLSAVSTRAHVLVLCPAPAGAAGAARVRERAPAYVPDRPAQPGPSIRARRASVLARRGRHAAAVRWLKAALAEACRRGDDERIVETSANWLAHLTARGEWNEALRSGRRLVASLNRWPTRAAVSGRVAQLAIENMDFDVAAALVGGVTAEAAVRDECEPPWVPRAAGEVAFWQGRFELASRRFGEEPPEGDVAVWQALAAWARGGPDPGRAGRRPDPPMPGEASDAFWASVAVSFRRAATGPPAGGADSLRQALSVIERTAPDALPCRRGLARAAAIELFHHFNRPAAARSLVFAPRQIWQSPLERLLLEWLEDRATGFRGAADLRARVVRCRAAGILRWGQGREGTRVLHTVPVLLQILTDAEDDEAALSAVCRWIRDHPGVEGAAVIGTDGRWAAAAGLTRNRWAPETLAGMCGVELPRVTVQDDTAVASAPVRYAGHRTGVVIVLGAREAVETAREIAVVVAPLCGPALRSRLDAIAADAAREPAMPEMVGVSPALGTVRRAAARVAATAFSVLIEGESGTGKELVARAIHRLSARRDRAFCPLNCAALTDELVETELFGHARGAFTGAVGPRTGLFEEAHGGTLFLDEVGELSPRAQAKLLRALQEREVRRLGENAARRVDVRVVAATNKALRDAVASGAFREDLLFRLAVVRIRLPALRERIEDVPMLARAFFAQLAGETGTRAVLGPEALAALARHRWPGNVRELQNVMAALVVAAPARGRIGARQVAAVLAAADGAAAAPPGLSLDAARRQYERRVIADALARHGGRRAHAARELGLSRQGLTKALRRVGLGARPDRAGVA